MTLDEPGIRHQRRSLCRCLGETWTAPTPRPQRGQPHVDGPLGGPSQYHGLWPWLIIRVVATSRIAWSDVKAVRLDVATTFGRLQVRQQVGAGATVLPGPLRERLPRDGIVLDRLVGPSGIPQDLQGGVRQRGTESRQSGDLRLFQEPAEPLPDGFFRFKVRGLGFLSVLS